MGEYSTSGWNMYKDMAQEFMKEPEFSINNATAESIAEIGEWSMQRDKALVERIVGAGELTWETIGESLNELNDGGIFALKASGFMAYVHMDKGVRDTADDVTMRVSQHSIELWYREDLYQKLKAYSETDDARSLTGEKARLLEDTMRDLKHMGHELDPAGKARMQELNTRMVDIGVNFEKNIREDKTLVTLSESEMEGVSQTVRDILKRNEEGGYLLDVGKYPEVGPFLDQAVNREARKKVYMAKETRVIEENRPLLEEAVAIREEIAGLLGYPSWAHLELEDCVAKTPDVVHAFYADIVEPLTEKGEQEIAVIEQMLHEDGYEGPVERYDWRFYDTKQRREMGVDKEKVSEYFTLEACLDGFKQICGEAFGIKFRQLDDEATWYEDDVKGVQVYAIDDIESGMQISQLYLDLFPRDGKYTHAAEFSLRGGRRLPDGSYRHPIAAVVANFTSPTADKPSLLTYDEATTLFHELGHALHEMLTTTELPVYAGTNVETDFVETISQIMEHWMEQPDIIRRFAKHYKTGEPLPEETLDKLIELNKLNLGLSTLRQVSFGYLDLKLHDEQPDKDLDTINIESSKLALMPHIDGTFMPATFGHLLGGYDAKYNGYIRSEARGDDLFTVFEERGLTSPEAGMPFRRIFFERGGSQDGDDMTTEYLGRPTNNEAFFKKIGITKNNK